MSDDKRVACLKRAENFDLTCIRAMPHEPAKWCVECCTRRYMIKPGEPMDPVEFWRTVAQQARRRRDEYEVLTRGVLHAGAALEDPDWPRLRTAAWAATHSDKIHDALDAVDSLRVKVGECVPASVEGGTHARPGPDSGNLGANEERGGSSVHTDVGGKSNDSAEMEHRELFSSEVTELARRRQKPGAAGSELGTTSDPLGPPPGVPDGSEVDAVREIVRQRRMTFDPMAKPTGDCWQGCGRPAKHVYASNSGRFSIAVCDICRHQVCPHVETVLLPNHARICKECNVALDGVPAYRFNPDPSGDWPAFPPGSLLPIGKMPIEAVTAAEVEQVLATPLEGVEAVLDEAKSTSPPAYSFNADPSPLMSVGELKLSTGGVPTIMMIKGGALTPEAIKRIENELERVKAGSAWLQPIIMDAEPVVSVALLKRYMRYVDDINGTSLLELDAEIQDGEDWPRFSDEEWALLVEVWNDG